MLLLLTGLFALCIGSFLNVVIYRLPQIIENREHNENIASLSLSKPGSHCPQCKHAIPIWGNIPLLGFLLLRGKCHYCKFRIAWRYPLVETLAMVVAVAVFAMLGFTEKAFAATAFSFALITLLFIDIETQLLPDIITLPFVWIGLLVNLNSTFVPIQDAVIGAVAGYTALWAIAFVFRKLRNIDGMGYGDFKCAAMLGAWLGWQALPWILVIASLSGTAFGIVYLVKNRLSRTTPIAFGPFLALGGFIYMMAQVL